MSDMSSWSGVGRVAKDGELRYGPTGTAVLRFRVVVVRSIPPRGEDGWKDQAAYFDIEVFGKTAEAKERFIRKGRTVVVEGELRPERWESEGKTWLKLTVFAHSVQVLADPERAMALRVVPAAQTRPEQTEGAPGWPAGTPGRKAEAKEDPDEDEDDYKDAVSF